MTKERQSADEHRQVQKESRAFADQARRHLTEIEGRQTNREHAFVQAALGFLNTEADTGLTLARVASQRSNAQDKARQCREARKAYDTVAKHLGRAADASSEELEVLNLKMKRLRDVLESLGEKF